MPLPSNAMPVDQVSVIVVDDAKFTCEMIRRTLSAAGYNDIRVATSAREALDMMRRRPANILLADWLMPEMDGLDLTQRVRQFDEDSNHYTYIVLLTARDGAASLTEAFAQGVDDFIGKSPDYTELLARIHAASRISNLQNALLQANRRLADLARQREERDCFDAVTGLGNRAYLERQIDNLLRHVESRGGSAALAMVRLNDFGKLREQYGEKVMGDLVEATANRLQQATRPLDVVTRVSNTVFGVLMQQDELTQCHPNSFRRLYQALNLRAYKTSVGFVSLSCAVAICGIGPTDAASRPEPAELIQFTCDHLDEAQLAGRVHVMHWQG